MCSNGLWSALTFLWDWFKYAVYEDESWQASEFGFDDVGQAEQVNPGDIRTYPTRLFEFERCGGKVLMHLGQQDTQITPFNTERFYKHLKGHRSTAAMDK